MGIDRLEVHQPDYKQNSWKEYSFEELGSIIGFFVKRASHRKNIAKKEKDLYDAKNYLAMMEEKLKTTSAGLGTLYEKL